MRLDERSLLLLEEKLRMRIERIVGMVRGGRGSSHNLLRRERGR
jgi:hypothetical protein